jgi:glycosyltransferase involved in cell wall biosynthesis
MGGIPPRHSVVVPVYGNRATLPAVLARLASVAEQLEGELEIVFVVDGSPDDSSAVLADVVPQQHLVVQVLEHSRNFGSFAAIRTGLAAARGDFIGVMAADLQEPPEVMLGFFEQLESHDFDVAVGRRTSRSDPGGSAVMSKVFWGLYRRTINPDIPPGGVDVFACTRDVAQRLILLDESHTSLVALLYWMGFRRVEVPYDRMARAEGKSGWTLRKKVVYLSDSVFAFTRIPIHALTALGVFGTVVTTVVAVVVLVAWLTGRIDSPGYTPLMLTMLFSTFLVLTGMGVLGSYVWRTYENTKRRPAALTRSQWTHDPRLETPQPQEEP